MKTEIMNYDHPSIQKVLDEKSWNTMPQQQAVPEIYEFVRNEIQFGYNKRDSLSASTVLEQGFGQCNTKANLFMTLLSAIDVPVRIRAFHVDKMFQKELIGIFYSFTPNNILHSWVEVFYEGEWIALEGVIVSDAYIGKIQKKQVITELEKPFLGYAIAVPDIMNPEIKWNGKDTFVQKEAIVEELGLYETPDEFYDNHQQNLGYIRNFFYENIVTKYMTRRARNFQKE